MYSLQHSVQITSTRTGTTLYFLTRDELYSLEHWRYEFNNAAFPGHVMRKYWTMDPCSLLSPRIVTFFILKTSVNTITFGRSVLGNGFLGSEFYAVLQKESGTKITKLDHMVHSAAYHHGKRTIVTSEIGALNGILVLKFLELSAQR